MYGTTAKGVNWTSTQTQRLRFKIISEFLPKDMAYTSLIDAGCGFGDFYTYLEKKSKLPLKYIGIDSLEDMFTIASNNTGCEILIKDITKEELPNADYIICSGAMNVLEKFETHLFIQNCYKSSKIAFIFNILYGNKESETYNYFTKKQLQNIAQDLGVQKALYKDDYMQNDITVVFFKK